MSKRKAIDTALAPLLIHAIIERLENGTLKWVLVDSYSNDNDYQSETSEWVGNTEFNVCGHWYYASTKTTGGAKESYNYPVVGDIIRMKYVWDWSKRPLKRMWEFYLNDQLITSFVTDELR